MVRRMSIGMSFYLLKLQQPISYHEIFAQPDNLYSLRKEGGLFRSDWRKGAVFSQLSSGGNRRLRFIGAMRRG
jgi:hypothetical protein